jgi:hypothetical protein
MALPFEAQPMEERLQDRAKRARNRETWHRETREDKLTYNMGAFIANEKDAMEDAIVALGDEAEGPFKVKMYTTLRQAWVRMAREYRKLNTAGTHDWEAAEDIYERGDAVEGMTEEEAKLLKKHLKKNEENGKVQKRRKAKETPYQRPEENSSGATGPGSSPNQWGVGSGLGWGMWPAQVAPTMNGVAPPMSGTMPPLCGLMPPTSGMAPPMSGIAPPLNGWAMGGPTGATYSGGPYGYEGNYGGQFNGGQHGGQYGYYHGGSQHIGNNSGGQYRNSNQGGGSGGGSSGGSGAAKKRTYPCDNCGSYDHWKSSPGCPKFYIYLDGLKAKSLSMQGGGNQDPGTGPSGYLALPAPGKG